jgi:hypothetical protein
MGIFDSMGVKDSEGAHGRMQTPESYVNERLDHLGVVAGGCEEIGLAAYLDGLAGETNHHVSMGTATVAMQCVLHRCDECHGLNHPL